MAIKALKYMLLSKVPFLAPYQLRGIVTCTALSQVMLNLPDEVTNLVSGKLALRYPIQIHPSRYASGIGMGYISHSSSHISTQTMLLLLTAPQGRDGLDTKESNSASAGTSESGVLKFEK